MKKFYFHQLTIALLSSLISVNAFAGGGGDTTIPHAVNLVLLIALIYFAAGSKLTSALKDRSASVAKDILEAQQLHQEAKDLLNQYESKLAELESSKEQLISQYRTEGEREKELLIAEGQKEAQRIQKNAQQQAEQQFARVQSRIEKEVVDAALKRARVLLIEKVTAQDQVRLNQDYVVSLEKLSAKNNEKQSS